MAVNMILLYSDSIISNTASDGGGMNIYDLNPIITNVQIWVEEYLLQMFNGGGVSLMRNISSITSIWSNIGIND